MKLFAISDLHVGFDANRKALASLERHPDDWLALAGDTGETPEHLELVLDIACDRFRKVLWVPGNHELWSVGDVHGVAKYDSLVAVCRRYGVATPEDPFPLWDSEGGPMIVAPLFILYDYSFRPQDVPQDMAVTWAKDAGIFSTDEVLLRTDPYPDVLTWADYRIRISEARLAEVAGSHPVVLVSHYPLRRDIVYVALVPRFSIWCGTTRTNDWHLRFNARVAVSGHLHVRTTNWRDGVRFEEVSLGYPNQWTQEKGCSHYLREILPGPPPPHPVHAGPMWRR